MVQSRTLLSYKGDDIPGTDRGGRGRLGGGGGKVAAWMIGDASPPTLTPSRAVPPI